MRRTLTPVRDQAYAYALNVSIYIPAGPGNLGRGPRSEEELAPMELASGAPSRHIALTAPFTNCAETAR